MAGGLELTAAAAPRGGAVQVPGGQIVASEEGATVCQGKAATPSVEAPNHLEALNHLSLEAVNHLSFEAVNHLSLEALNHVEALTPPAAAARRGAAVRRRSAAALNATGTGSSSRRGALGAKN